MLILVAAVLVRMSFFLYVVCSIIAVYTQPKIFFKNSCNAFQNKNKNIIFIFRYDIVYHFYLQSLYNLDVLIIDKHYADLKRLIFIVVRKHWVRR